MTRGQIDWSFLPSISVSKEQSTRVEYKAQCLQASSTNTSEKLLGPSIYTLFTDSPASPHSYWYTWLSVNQISIFSSPSMKLEKCTPCHHPGSSTTRREHPCPLYRVSNKKSTISLKTKPKTSILHEPNSQPSTEY